MKGNASNSERAVHRYEDAYSLTEKTVEDVAERPEVSGKRSGNAEESTDLRLLQNPSGGDEGFLSYGELRFHTTKTLREDRTAAVWKYVAIAPRRRRRISQARFLFDLKHKNNKMRREKK